MAYVLQVSMAEDCSFFRHKFRIGVIDGHIVVLKKGGAYYVCLRQCWSTAADLGLNVPYRKLWGVVKDNGTVLRATPRERACLVAIGALGTEAPSAILVGPRTLYRALHSFKDGTLPMRMVLKDLIKGRAVLKAVPVKVRSCARLRRRILCACLTHYTTKSAHTHSF